MKAAFVLGLAVAANAQVDNEFVGYNPSGANLVRDARWSQTHPSGVRTPIDYNTQYLNKYGGVKRDDEDNELYSGADLVKYAKQSQQTVYRPTAHVVRDDEADDELIVMKFNREHFKTEAEWKRYLMSRSEEADDELYSQQTVYRPIPHVIRKTDYVVRPTDHVVTPTEHVVRKTDYVVRPTAQDDADDELYSGADLVKYAKQSQQTVYRPTAHIVRDDEPDNELEITYRLRRDFKNQQEYEEYLARQHARANAALVKNVMNGARDDELVSLSGADLVKYAKQSQQTVYRPTAHVVRDDEADDELVQTFYSPSGADLVKYAKQSQQTVYRPTAHVVRDDEADDELVQTFYSPSGADLVKYAKQSQQTVYRPTAHVVRDDEADDELVQTFYSPSGADLVKYAKQSQQTVYRPTAHVVRDDEADDELVQTFYSPSGADLVKYAKQSQQTVYRPTAHVVRDDEADDELVQTFYSPSGADLVKYAKQSQQTVYRPTAHVVRDDEADDELVQTFYSPSGADLVKYAKQSQQTVYRPTAHVVRDDADDELALLGQLIKEAQPEKVEKKTQRKFRHAEKN